MREFLKHALRRDISGLVKAALALDINQQPKTTTKEKIQWAGRKVANLLNIEYNNDQSMIKVLSSEENQRLLKKTLEKSESLYASEEVCIRYFLPKVGGTDTGYAVHVFFLLK